MEPSWYALDVLARVRYLRNLGTAPLTDVDDAGGVTTVITGIFSNTLNGALDARLESDDADEAIAATIERFARRRAPAIWYVDDLSTPADLRARLRAHGCRPEETGIVRGGEVARLLARAAELAGDGDVVAVRSPADLDRWLEAARAIFGSEADDPPGDLDRTGALLRGLGLDSSAPLQHWVALDGGRPVGMASAFYTGDVVLIDHEDVVSDAQRQGFGTRLMLAALGEADRRGCRWAVLEPTPEAAAFYDALGFAIEPAGGGREYYLPLRAA